MFKDIYLFDADGLANALKEQTISDAAALKNFLVFLVLFSYSYEIPVHLNPAPSDDDPGFMAGILFWVVTAAANIYGLKIAFHANERGDGADFFKRFCALSLPVSVITTLVFVAVLLVVLVAGLLISESASNLLSSLYAPLGVLLGLSYLFVFYRMMKNHMTTASCCCCRSKTATICRDLFPD